MNANYKINGTVIETERVILRPFKASDLADFFEYASVDGVGEMAGWCHHESMDKSKEILDRFISEEKTFAITLKESGKVIGSIGVEKYGMEEKLSEFFELSGREIGFVLSKDYWGQGIMAEAVNGLIDHLFNKIGLDFLLCGHYDFNAQSKRVQEKCGFKPYRALMMDTRIGTKEKGTLNLLLNPNKDITLKFSHPETLIYDKQI
ncbi:MAG: GNAT family N-acetyltransferase [Clostridia bacterium]|nr:GNAT family N-acetyltransferase [Clostridia bacterium]